MNFTDLKHKFAVNASFFKIVSSMALMLYFGYHIAGYQHSTQQKEIASLTKSIDTLSNDNTRLLQQVNQTATQLALSEQQVKKLGDLLTEKEQTVDKLQREIAFYAHVIEPEASQEGFLADSAQVAYSEDTNFYSAKVLLLQQRKIRAMVKGTLAITIEGFEKGVPTSYVLGKNQNLSPIDIQYGFKYFQSIEFIFQLPTNFKPESLIIDTAVYQYKRKRGDYQRKFDWQSILDEAKISID